MSHCHKMSRKIVSLSHCLEQLLYLCILFSYVKACLIFGGDACESAWLKTVCLFYFLWANALMRTWRLAVISGGCQLINYTLATEENVGNVRVCACCNHILMTGNEFYHNTQPNSFECSHKVHFSKRFFTEKYRRFYRSA